MFSPAPCWDVAGSLTGRVSLSTSNHLSGLYGEGVSFTLDLLSLFTVCKVVEPPPAQEKSQLKPVRGSAEHKERV